MGQNTQAKVILPTNSPLFGLQRSHTSPLSYPPLPRPYLRTMCPAVAVHILPRQQPHTAKMCQRPRRQDQSFFFPQPTVFPIFLAITLYTLYNIVILFSHLFLFLNSFQTAYNFKSTSFSFFCWFFFFSSFLFLWTTSFTFFVSIHLCICFVIRNYIATFLYQLKYRTAPIKWIL